MDSQHSQKAEQNRATAAAQTQKEKDKKKVEEEKIVRCKLCGCEVKKKNLKKHVRRIHEEAKSQSWATRKQSFRVRNYDNNMKMTSGEARKQREALEDNKLGSDEAIADYLRKHPKEEEMGKFGVPQDKYRWGFYGSRTMEYDSWGRSHKEKEK